MWNPEILATFSNPFSTFGSQFPTCRQRASTQWSVKPINLQHSESRIFLYCSLPFPVLCSNPSYLFPLLQSLISLPAVSCHPWHQGDNSRDYLSELPHHHHWYRTTSLHQGEKGWASKHESKSLDWNEHARNVTEANMSIALDYPCIFLYTLLSWLFSHLRVARIWGPDYIEVANHNDVLLCPPHFLGWRVGANLFLTNWSDSWLHGAQSFPTSVLPLCLLLKYVIKHVCACVSASRYMYSCQL